jgi:hypothetical protein
VIRRRHAPVRHARDLAREGFGPARLVASDAVTESPRAGEVIAIP